MKFSFFMLNIVNLTQQIVKFNGKVYKTLNWYLTYVYPDKSALSNEISLKNNDAVERHGTSRRLRRVTMPCVLYLMVIWLVIDVFHLTYNKLFFWNYYVESIATRATAVLKRYLWQVVCTNPGCYRIKWVKKTVPLPNTRQPVW